MAELIKVYEVKTKSQLREFIHFPVRLYRDNPHYVPDLLSEERAYFTPSQNPAYEYCETKLFLAYDDGRLAGRIAAILNAKYNEKTGEKRMRFSRFDVEDNPRAAKALLAAVETFAKDRGMDIIHGPIGFSDLDKQGMLVEGFDLPDTSITLYNHPYYLDFMAENGYEKEADWIEFLLKPSKETTERVSKLSAYVQKMFGIRSLNLQKLSDIKPYVGEIFELINSAYGNLYGFTPLTKKMQQYYYDQYFRLVNFEYVALCLDSDGKVAGFGLAFPSIAKALKKSDGRLLPLGFARILRALKKADVLELALIAVRSDFVGKGLNAVIIDRINRAVVKHGIVAAETGPQLETNNKIQDQWKKICTDLTQHKRRRCFVKHI